MHEPLSPVSVDVRRTLRRSLASGTSCSGQQSVPAAPSYGSPGQHPEDKAPGPPAPAEKFACLQGITPGLTACLPQSRHLALPALRPQSTSPSPRGRLCWFTSQVPPLHIEMSFWPRPWRGLLSDLGIPLDATEDQQATAAIIPPEPSFLEPPWMRAPSARSSRRNRPNGRTLLLQSRACPALIGGTPGDTASWPVGRTSS